MQLSIWTSFYQELIHKTAITNSTGLWWRHSVIWSLESVTEATFTHLSVMYVLQDLSALNIQQILRLISSASTEASKSITVTENKPSMELNITFAERKMSSEIAFVGSGYQMNSKIPLYFHQSKDLLKLKISSMVREWPSLFLNRTHKAISSQPPMWKHYLTLNRWQEIMNRNSMAMWLWRIWTLISSNMWECHSVSSSTTGDQVAISMTS